ncbi:MAG: polysaccharide biosynthesis protein, partial [Clostridia bacterium]|nr:polysaccharide biosynthesis protein [Clostridia bacterium]
MVYISVELLKAMPVQEIVIAIPDSNAEVKAALYDRYRKSGCPVKIYDYLGNEESLSGKRTLRDFNIEDLLFRRSIKLDNELTAHYYTGKTVLVTGGGGSIGSELCRQIAKQKPVK